MDLIEHQNKIALLTFWEIQIKEWKLAAKQFIGHQSVSNFNNLKKFDFYNENPNEITAISKYS